MRPLLIPILCALFLTACHKHKNDDPEPKANLSVLVYIAGDCNLDASYYDIEEGRYINFVDEDIRQMMEGSKQLSKQQNLIVFVDRKNLPPYFLKVANGDTTRLYTYPEEMKSSDAATLKNALQWVKDNYEAENYGLSLWGHADGWTISPARAANAPRRAYGQDTANGTTWMNIPDMAKALEEVCAGKPLRFIFADCCCFQSIESAYELRNCTDYVIGSPAEIPGEGAPYNTVIPALFSNTNYWQMAVDAYFAQKSEDYEEPLSVIKTSELENLAQATKATLTQSLEPLNSDGTNYPDVSNLIYYYDHCLYDMNDFMLRNTSSDVYTQWKRSYDAAVPYKKMATVWMSSSNHVPYIGNNYTVFHDFDVTEERFGGVNMYVAQNANSLPTRYRNYAEKQRLTISQMQWYKAAGYDALGW